VRLELLTTPHGTVALVDLPDASVDEAAATLAPEEQALARTLSPVRRRELIAGRTALRALLSPELARHPLLPDDRGAPQLPPGWVGSVSHKGSHAAAILAPSSDPRAHVGVDLELAAPPKQDIARWILTRREQASLADRALGATLRFSIKEAIYKAVDPFVRRYVAFTEVELDVGDSTAAVTTELPLAIETTWRQHGRFWLATARARAR